MGDVQLSADAGNVKAGADSASRSILAALAECCVVGEGAMWPNSCRSSAANSEESTEAVDACCRQETGSAGSCPVFIEPEDAGTLMRDPETTESMNVPPNDPASPDDPQCGVER